MIFSILGEYPDSGIFAGANNHIRVLARANNQIPVYSPGFSNLTIILDLIAFRNPEVLIFIGKQHFLYLERIIKFQYIRRANNQIPVFTRANNQITAYSSALSNSTIIIGLIAFPTPQILIFNGKHYFLYLGRITKFQYIFARQ